VTLNGLLLKPLTSLDNVKVPMLPSVQASMMVALLGIVLRWR